MATFVPNGLLGQPTPTISNEGLSFASFTPNGLLGTFSEPVLGKDMDVEMGEQLDVDTTVPILESSKGKPDLLNFAPNGLLGMPSSSAVEITQSHVTKVADSMFVPNGLLSESQDDDLPTISQLLESCPNNGPPPRPRSPATSTSSTYRPRLTVRATTFDGKAVFIKRKQRTFESSRKTTAAGTSAGQRVANLLDVPIHRMMDQLAATAAAKLDRNDRASNLAAEDPTATVEDTLWVDRYRPRRFTELMGNEKVAREVMGWVKQWDWCVFGKNKMKGKGKKRSREEEEDKNYVEDEYQRPKEKLLLLSGPPGLGKTTLAHVIARQAGYEVMEINASDARSGQIVDDRIRPALESGSAVGSSKPVLLIIDEIDGATGAGDNSSSFIHKLVQLTYDKPRKKLRSGQARDPQSKRPILRPIICICNDQNASSLTKLRPHAYQIRFSRPADLHTVKRLREVCELEGLKADTRALSTLVGVARGDLRGCLNTLQFVKSRNEEVTEAVIRGATIGMKEADSSITSVVNGLFNPLSRKRVKELGLGDEDEAKYVGRLSREVDGSGKESSIAVGCFAHYATLRHHDATFSRHEKATEWLVSFDLLSSNMYSDGDFALSGYLPYMLVPFYPLFQERGGQRVERNQADWEALQTMRSNEEVYKSLSRCLRTASSHHGGDFRHLVSTPILQLEFAPYINRIISPPIRPVNRQVIRPEEQALLSRLVGIMGSLELRFLQERAEDGQLTYRLDPPIDVFVTYDGKRASDIAVSRYAVRHLVAGEIDAFLIARQADAVEKGKPGKLDYFSKMSAMKKNMTEESKSSTKMSGPDSSGLPNKRAKKDDRDIADKPPTDFFGRLITVPSASSTKAAARKNVEKKYRVTYRYTEGNSAAVRKPVKVGAFL